MNDEVVELPLNTSSVLPVSALPPLSLYEATKPPLLTEPSLLKITLSSFSSDVNGDGVTLPQYLKRQS